MASGPTHRKSIAILGTRGIPANYGGFETFADTIGRRLVEAGHRVIVTCERHAQDEAPATRYEGVELVHVSAPRLGPFSTIVHDVLCLWRLRRETDVVYLLGYGAAFFAFVPRLFKKEVWINPDGLEWKRGKWNAVARLWFRIMEWLTMRVASLVVADAHALQEILVRRHGTRTPIVTIAYGTAVLEEPQAETAVREHGLDVGGYFLAICRFEPENHLLEIVEGYRRAGVSSLLVIVGDHTSETPYVQLLRAAAADVEGVRFLGVEFDPARLASLRTHCRAYVHGHSVGGTNPSLLEALGAGAPTVIAHDNPFNREVLSGVPAEWFVSTADCAAAFQRAHELSCADAEARRTAARARARDAYDWDLVAEQYARRLSGDPRGESDSERDEPVRKPTVSPMTVATDDPDESVAIKRAPKSPGEAPRHAPLDHA